MCRSYVTIRARAAASAKVWLSPRGAGRTFFNATMRGYIAGRVKSHDWRFVYGVRNQDRAVHTQPLTDLDGVSPREGEYWLITIGTRLSVNSLIVQYFLS